MYPILRASFEYLRAKRQPQIDLFEPHFSTIRIYPWDLDFFWELNNGRTLTLYDIPRIMLAVRTGLWKVMRKEKMALTVAGASIQYRKRITVFQKITMSAQCVGFDDRFIYIVQNTYRGDIPCGQALLRLAFAKNGIVSPKEVLKNYYKNINPPELPDWVKVYVKAAQERPWPPETPITKGSS